MQRLEPFNDQIARLNMTPRTQVLCFERRSAGAAGRAFGRREDDTLIYLERLRYADETPIVVVQTYLPVEFEAILQEDLSRIGLYDYLKRDDVSRVVRVRREVNAMLSSPYEERLLKVPPRSALQHTVTWGYNRAQRVIEHSTAYYRGDMNTFVVELAVEV
jgi:GntR family transcriptional regulator